MGKVCYNRINVGDVLTVRSMLTDVEVLEQVSVIADSSTILSTIRRAKRKFKMEGYRYIDLENETQGWRALYYKNGVKM